MAGRLLDEDPERAYAHAKQAQRLSPRLSATREAVGLAAYLTGQYGEALAELRTVRRLSGTTAHWAIMADCERGLGRPERALAMANAPEVAQLDRNVQIELRIVAAGARRDQGNLDAALVLLQGADLDDSRPSPYIARLRYAYADALLAGDRRDEARHWFAEAAYSDEQGVTDAADRLTELDGIDFVDALDVDADDDDPDELDASGLDDADGAEPVEDETVSGEFEDIDESDIDEDPDA